MQVRDQATRRLGPRLTRLDASRFWSAAWMSRSAVSPSRGKTAAPALAPSESAPAVTRATAVSTRRYYEILSEALGVRDFLEQDLGPLRLLAEIVGCLADAGFDDVIAQDNAQLLAVGEVFNTIYDCQQLIQEQLIDYIRTTVVHAGGITHLKKIAHLAEMYQVRTGSHGATDLSPVCMAAALHFDLSVHNFGIQEYMRHTTETDRVFPHSYSFENGLMHPGEAPGLGVNIDESLAAKWPYERAYLPVNRKLDGTMHNW